MITASLKVEYYNSSVEDDEECLCSGSKIARSISKAVSLEKMILLALMMF